MRDEQQAPELKPCPKCNDCWALQVEKQQPPLLAKTVVCGHCGFRAPFESWQARIVPDLAAVAQPPTHCARCGVDHWHAMLRALVGIFDYTGNDWQAVKNTAYRAIPETECQTAASLQPPSPQSEEIASEMLEGMLDPQETPSSYREMVRRISSALTAAQSKGAELQREVDAIDALRSQGCNVTFWCTPRSVVTQITFDDEDRSPDIDNAFPSLKEGIEFAARAAKQQ